MGGCFTTGILSLGNIAIALVGIGNIVVGYFTIGNIALGKFAIGNKAFGLYPYSLGSKFDIADILSVLYRLQNKPICEVSKNWIIQPFIQLLESNFLILLLVLIIVLVIICIFSLVLVGLLRMKKETWTDW